jgi:hypothetical protein
MEETSIRTTSDFIDDIGLEINVERTGHMFARRSLGEEGTEAIVIV